MTCLDAPALMVNVVVAGVVRSEVLKRIPWQRIATMIINRLYGGTRKEPHALTSAQACQLERNACSQCIQEKAFQRMVVQGAKSIRNVEAVVTRMYPS